METIVSVKTRTEVDKNGVFLISSFTDMNVDGTITPVIFESEVLSSFNIIDNVQGKEGELILSYIGSSVGEIDQNGNLELEVDNDDVDLYNQQNGDLTYG